MGGDDVIFDVGMCVAHKEGGYTYLGHVRKVEIFLDYITYHVNFGPDDRLVEFNGDQIVRAYYYTYLPHPQ